MDLFADWLRQAVENKTAMDHLTNMVIPLFSMLGVFLSTSLSLTVRRFGFAIGLVSQPFWFYLAFASHSLGLVINSLFFTALWVYRCAQAYSLLRRNHEG